MSNFPQRNQWKFYEKNSLFDKCKKDKNKQFLVQPNIDEYDNEENKKILTENIE